MNIYVPPKSNINTIRTNISLEEICSTPIQFDQISSLLIKNIFNKRLMIWAMKSLDKLVMSPIDSKYGISLVTESPYGTTLLNVSRPAVLRQYYGTNVGTKKDGKIKIRATYGLSVLKNSVGTDPLKFVTKPFNKYLYRISLYVTHIIRQLPNEYGYSKMKLSNHFNLWIVR